MFRATGDLPPPATTPLSNGDPLPHPTTTKQRASVKRRHQAEGSRPSTETEVPRAAVAEIKLLSETDREFSFSELSAENTVRSSDLASRGQSEHNLVHPNRMNECFLLLPLALNVSDPAHRVQIGAYVTCVCVPPESAPTACIPEDDSASA